MEVFSSIQGEGYHQGRAAHFIRLGGCDVGCTWCDVKESWDAERHPQVPVEKLVKSVGGHKSNMVIITGGEPVMYNLDALCKRLKKESLSLHLETSGAYPLTGEWDWICLSPKKFKPPTESILKRADELKVIVYNHHDFKWAASFANKISENCKLFLQPEWSREKKMLPYIIDFVKSNPKWQISLQIHKYLGVE